MYRRLASMAAVAVWGVWIVAAARADGVTVTGTVTNQQGQPVAGAKLWLTLRYELNPDEPPWLVAGESGADGSFSLTVPDKWLASNGELANRMLWGYAEGCNVAAASAYKQVAGKSSDPLSLQLSRASAVEFNVQSPSGEPVEGARIEPAIVKQGENGYGYLPEPIRGLLAATTDASGHATIVGCAPDAFYSVRAVTDDLGTQDFSQLSQGGVKSTFTLRLRPVGALLVALSGGDQADFAGRHFIVASDPRHGDSTLAGAYASATTDQTGTVRVDNVVAGSVLLYFTSGDESKYRPQMPDTITVKEGEETTVDVRLVQGVELRGRVVTHDDHRPVPGAGISISSGGPFQTQRTTTDEDGNYTAYVLPGEARVQVTQMPEAFRTWTRHNPSYEAIAVAEDAEHVDVPDIELVETRTLAGKLVDSKGNPAAGWQLMAGQGNTNLGGAMTGGDGSFEFSVASTADIDRYTAHHNEPGKPYQRLDAEVTSTEPLVLTLESEVPENVTITTEPTPASKRPAAAPEEETAGINVTIAKNVLLVDGHVATWADVSDRLMNIESDEQKVVNYSFTQAGQERREEAQMWMDMLGETVGARTGSQTFTVSQTFDQLELGDLWPPANYQPIVGTVTDAQGTPVANVQVLVHQPPADAEQWQWGNWSIHNGRVRDDATAIWTTTDEQGQFELSVDPSREFTLIAMSPDGFAYQSIETISAAHDLHLTPWGRIVVDVVPGNDERAGCYVSLPGKSGRTGLSLAFSSNEDSGEFDFPTVPPGLEARVNRMVSRDTGEYTLYLSTDRYVNVTPEPGQTVRVKFGPMTQSEKKQIDRQLEQYKQ